MVPTYFLYAALGLAAVLFYVLVRALDPESVVHKMLFAGGLNKPTEPQATPVSSAKVERDMPLVEPQAFVRARNGYMIVNRNDRYLGQAILTYGESCQHELEVLFKLCAVTSGTVLEIGANMGVHTLPLAKALAEGGRSMAVFEPQPVVFQNLCANLAANAVENVRAWPFAVGEENTVVYFDKPNYRDAGNFGGVTMAASSSPSTISVPEVRLDDFVEGEVVGLMKIDVCGSELEVLRGAERLLDAQLPVLYVANDRPEKSKRLIEWLLAHGYALWWHIPGLYNGGNFFGETKNIYEGIASFNMLAIHHSQALAPIDFLDPGTVEQMTDPEWHPMRQ